LTISQKTNASLLKRFLSHASCKKSKGEIFEVFAQKEALQNGERKLCNYKGFFLAKKINNLRSGVVGLFRGIFGNEEF
jgi:hypothetical protein